ncbi:MAG: hypothetical protein ABL893_07945 [Hyphomicrobium sp.]|nr:hypothetical protein [Hyphomicrobium sp.]
MRISGLALGAIAALALSAGASLAAPLPNLSAMKDGALAQSQIEKTHGWHRTCRRGLNGSHKHVRGVGRIQCGTAKCWTNAWGYKRCKYF